MFALHFEYEIIFGSFPFYIYILQSRKFEANLEGGLIDIEWPTN